MSDTYNKVTAILKTGKLYEVVTLIPYMKTTQVVLQSYDANGNPVAGINGATVGVKPYLVGDPSGESLTPDTIPLDTPKAITYTDTFLAVCVLTIDSIPTGVEEIHITIVQSIH